MTDCIANKFQSSNTQQTTKHQRNRFISLDLGHYRIKTKTKLSQLKKRGKKHLSETSRKCIFKLSFKHICRKPDVNVYLHQETYAFPLRNNLVEIHKGEQEIMYLGVWVKDLSCLTLIWELSVSCLRDLAAK